MVAMLRSLFQYQWDSAVHQHTSAQWRRAFAKNPTLLQESFQGKGSTVDFGENCREIPVFNHCLYMSLSRVSIVGTYRVHYFLFYTNHHLPSLCEADNIYTNINTNKCTSVIQDCMNHSLVSAQRLLWCYFLVNISTSIWQGAFLRTQTRPWVQLFVQQKQTKKCDPQPKMQRQALKGEYLERG